MMHRSLEPSQLRKVLRESVHKASGDSKLALDLVLQQAGPWGEGLGAALAQTLGLRYLSPAELQLLTPDFTRISLADALQRECLVMSPGCNGSNAIAVLGNPLDASLQDWMRARLQGTSPIDLCACDLPALQDVLARLGAHARTLESVSSAAAGQLRETNAPDTNLVVLALDSMDDPSPVVRLVSSTLFDALRDRASDVHLLRTASGVQVRYRIDGALCPATFIEGHELGEQMISRIKVLSDLDIAERRVPQDGKFQVSFDGRSVDIRVSIMPSLHGEAAVMRLLDTQTVLAQGKELRLDDLGFDATTVSHLRGLAALPYGMVLVTGPTGSGKTTTLYAAISEIHQGSEHFLTIEDPIEYELRQVEQIPVNEKQGLTFARGLRSILRHDPDRIMVGEIRDRETAEMAVQAALTGHAVYSTLHANNAIDVFNRLAYMGLDPYALTSALNGIWAQRLVRINCPNCSTSYKPDPGLLDSILRSANPLAGQPEFARGAGCSVCRGTGYRGRLAVAEVITLDDSMREMIVRRASVAEIKQRARSMGTRFLRDAALDVALAGRTTIEEVIRVTMAA